ncbi:MAG: hypothetical protein LKI03_01555 [Acetobacter indonesiensis]|jgi:dTDP-glucose pyrophosphorylase|nr:hypothetical protein [Acetobacter indonesiensis]MCI1764724.1 hypothetical protein [Acetobacter indonesiensis]
MNILIPMAGAGSRFSQEGYTQHKPVIPTTLRRTGQKAPMVVAAVEDLPVDPQESDNNITFVVRDFHISDGVTKTISKYYDKAQYVSVNQLTQGQASTCLLARDYINTPEPLMVAACDNGMDLDTTEFQQAADKADALIFTFRNNEAVCAKPEAYGWVQTEGTKALGVSIKKPLSDNPTQDHAVVGTFWFRHGSDFVDAAETMIAANDRINDEFYVDQVFKYLINSGLNVHIFEIDRYLCWGTPNDYELYENTIEYWRNFLVEEKKR